MINALFGFRGRLGRLAFLGWNLVGMILVGAITIAFLVLGTVLAALGVPSGGATILGVLMALTAGGAGIWMTLALLSKRVRDIGLAPLPLLIGAIALLALDDTVLLVSPICASFRRLPDRPRWAACLRRAGLSF